MVEERERETDDEGMERRFGKDLSHWKKRSPKTYYGDRWSFLYPRRLVHRTVASIARAMSMDRFGRRLRESCLCPKASDKLPRALLATLVEKQTDTDDMGGATAMARPRTQSCVWSRLCATSNGCSGPAKGAEGERRLARGMMMPSRRFLLVSRVR